MPVKYNASIIYKQSRWLHIYKGERTIYIRFWAPYIYGVVHAQRTTAEDAYIYRVERHAVRWRGLLRYIYSLKVRASYERAYIYGWLSLIYKGTGLFQLETERFKYYECIGIYRGGRDGGNPQNN